MIYIIFIIIGVIDLYESKVHLPIHNTVNIAGIEHSTVV